MIFRYSSNLPLVFRNLTMISLISRRTAIHQSQAGTFFRRFAKYDAGCFSVSGSFE